MDCQKKPQFKKELHADSQWYPVLSSLIKNNWVITVFISDSWLIPIVVLYNKSSSKLTEEPGYVLTFCSKIKV